jgi:hypothetical protein
MRDYERREEKKEERKNEGTKEKIIVKSSMGFA